MKYKLILSYRRICEIVKYYIHLIDNNLQNLRTLTFNVFSLTYAFKNDNLGPFRYIFKSHFSVVLHGIHISISTGSCR